MNGSFIHILFQFQYGSIKRFKERYKEKDIQEFQFQYGSIKSLDTGLGKTIIEYFNSNMVRLKV